VTYKTHDELIREIWRDNWYKPSWWIAWCLAGFLIWIKYTVLKDV
jgi:hypothetical protein